MADCTAALTIILGCYSDLFACNVYHHYHLVPLIPPHKEFTSWNLKHFQFMNDRFVERLSIGLHLILVIITECSCSTKTLAIKQYRKLGKYLVYF